MRMVQAAVKPRSTLLAAALTSDEQEAAWSDLLDLHLSCHKGNIRHGHGFAISSFLSIELL